MKYFDEPDIETLVEDGSLVSGTFGASLAFAASTAIALAVSLVGLGYMGWIRVQARRCRFGPA